MVSSLRTKLDALVAPDGVAPEDLAPVFHDQFVALTHTGADKVDLVKRPLEESSTFSWQSPS